VEPTGGSPFSSATAATAVGDSGAGPIRVPETLPPPTLLRPLCGFPVLLTTLVDREVDTIFPVDANGDQRVIVTGYYLAQYANLATGKTLTTNVSGPLFFTFHPDGTITAVLVGLSQYDLIPTDTPPGPAILTNAGRVVIPVFVNSHFIVDSQTGHLQDLCALLS
jgi:hypothetical protein